MSGIGTVTRVPNQYFVDIRKLQRRSKGANVGNARQPPGGSFKHQANHLRAFKQKRYQQKALNGHVDSTANSQPADMLIGQVQLPVGSYTVNQMWKPLVLFHCKSIVANVRVLCIGGAEPPIAE